MNALLIDGPFFHQSAQVAFPAPARATIRAVPSGAATDTLEHHEYGLVRIDPNPRGRPLAIYASGV